MRAFTQIQNRSQKPVSSNFVRPHKRASLLNHARHVMPNLQSTLEAQVVRQDSAEGFNVGSTSATSSRFAHNLSRAPLHHPSEGVIQRKLTISKPGDEYEREADRMAEIAAGMPGLGFRGDMSVAGQRPHSIQRMCLHYRDRLSQAGDVREATSHRLPSIIATGVHEAVRSTGQPLEASTRSFMEQRFGCDFGRVKVHTDAKAARSARDVNARAYTAGSDVVFGAGEYAPTTRSGRSLIAHELVHVVQQQQAVSSTVRPVEASDPSEQEAVAASSDVMSGRAVPLLQARPAQVARQVHESNEEATEQPHVPFEPFGNLTTYAQLAAAARFGIGQVQADLREVSPDHPVRVRAAEWIEGVRSWMPYLEEQGSAQLTPAAAAQARLHLEEGVAIREAIADARRAVIRREMNRVADRARAAARKVQELRPHLDDLLRAAFRSGDSDIIRSLANTIGNTVDIGMGLHELARETVEAIASLRRIDLPAVGRYVTALDNLNRGLAALNLAFSLTQTEATTQIEEGMRQLTVAASAFSSLGTLAGLPAHIGLYANLYLVPMTEAIVAGLFRLTGLIQEENDIWVAAFGEPLRYEVEPGGRPMWRFMVSVMQARSAAAIPEIADEVDEYLVEHREALEAGSGEEMPTEGWWFWRSLHAAQARNWIFNNRNRLWAMFYGSRTVPD